VKYLLILQNLAATLKGLVEALFVAIGCQVIEGTGSSVGFEKEGHRARFHRPHPQKAALVYRVKDARAFLEQIGVTL
jgi:hypothetical protein